jgi:hypothetical protein
MHQLAEREKHQEKIGKENMQQQHKGMTAKGHIVGQFRFKIQQTVQINPIVLHR